MAIGGGLAHFVLKLPLPSRIPILYVILSVLALISVVPMYFYSEQVEAINRERLITNETPAAKHRDTLAGG